MRHRAPGPPDLGPVLPACIHEVNTWVWLGEVSERAGRRLTLAEVPASEWDALVPDGVDCVWLMGVWERSPAGRAVALGDDGLRRSWDEALPGWTEDDVLGSPYSVRDYVCADDLGGREGLAAARTALADRGARLIVDLVPNHVAPDHPLVTSRPDAFIIGSAEDLSQDPTGFLE
ncbi:MAG TPA: alpha-amylase, partial [Candidatus Limnocylindria bacterium]|nr:alpha-amylase [Candidatus Limnocylindria bacterium]